LSFFVCVETYNSRYGVQVSLEFSVRVCSKLLTSAVKQRPSQAMGIAFAAGVLAGGGHKKTLPTESYRRCDCRVRFRPRRPDVPVDTRPLTPSNRTGHALREFLKVLKLWVLRLNWLGIERSTAALTPVDECNPDVTTAMPISLLRGHFCELAFYVMKVTDRVAGRFFIVSKRYQE
jgi:hypothetical protein